MNTPTAAPPKRADASEKMTVSTSRGLKKAVLRTSIKNLASPLQERKQLLKQSFLSTFRDRRQHWLQSLRHAHVTEEMLDHFRAEEWKRFCLEHADAFTDLPPLSLDEWIAEEWKQERAVDASSRPQGLDYVQAQQLLEEIEAVERQELQDAFD